MLDGVHHLPVEEFHRVEPGVGAGQGAAYPGQIDDAAAVGERGGGGPALYVVERADRHRAVGGQGDAFVVELVGDQAPALVLLADPARGRHPDVVVVTGGRVVRGQGVDDRAGVAGVARRDQQHRDALVERYALLGRGRADREPDPVGGVAVRRPDLLAVDRVRTGGLVPVPYRAGLQGRQVGASVRLAVADGEVDLAGEDPRQEVRLLLIRAEAHDRRSDRVQRHQRQGHTRLRRLVEEDELFHRGQPPPPELGRPSDPEPAVGAEPPHGLPVEPLLRGRVRVAGVDVLRDQLGEVRTQFGAQAVLGGRVLEVHGGLPWRRSCGVLGAVRRATAATVERVP